MELQFYGPGYVPQFEGFGCSGTQYCAAMTIDSESLDQNKTSATTPIATTTSSAEAEPVNWAYVTPQRGLPGPGEPVVHRYLQPTRTLPPSILTTART